MSLTIETAGVPGPLLPQYAAISMAFLVRSALSATDAEAVRVDYRHVLTQLGPCGRTIER